MNRLLSVLVYCFLGGSLAASGTYALATTTGCSSAHADSARGEPQGVDPFVLHELARSRGGGEVLLVAQAETGSAAGLPSPSDAGSASAPAPSSGSAATPAPKLPDPPSVDQVTKLWRAGNFLATGALVLYLLLTLALKFDKKHAFYISAGLAGVGMVVDTVNRGDTPTLGMLITAATTIAAIIVKGPEKPPAK